MDKRYPLIFYDSFTYLLVQKSCCTTSTKFKYVFQILKTSWVSCNCATKATPDDEEQRCHRPKAFIRTIQVKKPWMFVIVKTQKGQSTESSVFDPSCCKRQKRQATMTMPLYLFFFVCILLCCNARRQPYSHSTTHHPLSGLSTRKRHVYRTLQSWGIRYKSKPRSRALSSHNINDTGSVLTFDKPTKEKIAEWFGAEDDSSDQILHSMLRKEFNHDSVGMTNPFLHLDGESSSNSDENSLLLSVDSGDMHDTRPASVSRIEDSSSTSPSWWPTLSFSPVQKQGWRVLTYRKQVGVGKDCYERVRNAALDWEFQSDDGLIGLKEVPSSSFLLRKSIERNSNKYPKRGSYSVRSTPADNGDEPMAYHRSIGSFRRLVSYSASRFPFLRKIYAVNPVMVIYDLVDQR